MPTETLAATSVLTSVATNSSTAKNHQADAMFLGMEELEHLVDTLVASWHSSPHIVQNRSDHRMGFPHPIVVQPVDEQSLELSEEPRLASGRDISQSGISFTHSLPIPHKVIRVTCHPESGNPVSMLVKLTWCRFSREGCYQSGGKFLLSGPEHQPVHIDWESLPSA